MRRLRIKINAKAGAATSAVMTPIGRTWPGNDGAGDDVGSNQEGGADERGRGAQPAVPHPDEKPCCKRDEKANEADRADDADHDRGHQRGQADQHDLDLPDIDAERRRGFRAECKGIERVGAPDACEEPDNRDRNGQPYVASVRRSDYPRART